MVSTVLEVIHLIVFVGMAWMISSLYDRIELLEDREGSEEVESVEEWQPVDLSDEREFEIQQQEIKRGYFN